MEGAFAYPATSCNHGVPLPNQKKVSMPYLRITCPAESADHFPMIAEKLTEAVNELFFNPRSPVTRDELRQRTTIHFVPYKRGELYVGGKTPEQRQHPDITVELSDWYLSVSRQRRIASKLTPLLASLFGVAPSALDNVNIRFHSYPPSDFSVGGRLLQDLTPFAGRLAKRIFG